MWRERILPEHSRCFYMLGLPNITRPAVPTHCIQLPSGPFLFGSIQAEQIPGIHLAGDIIQFLGDAIDDDNV